MVTAKFGYHMKVRIFGVCCEIWLSHSLKMGFIAVEVTEVSSLTITIRTG